MTWLVSAPFEGSFLLVRLPEAAAIHVRFSDTGEVRDITDWVPDLMLIGLVTRAGRAQMADTVSTDQVTVAELTLVGADDLEAVFVNPGTNQTEALHWPAAAELVTIGIAEQLTAAVSMETGPDSELGQTEDQVTTVEQIADSDTNQ